MLCGAGADVNVAQSDSTAPLFLACLGQHLECVQVLSSYGAAREFGRLATAETLAWHAARAAPGTGEPADLACHDWLVQSRDWTPLHHIEVLTVERARSLLRAGADPHAGSPSPLELAECTPGDVSALLRRASRWSLDTHAMFPAPLRARAVALLRVGYQLAWSSRFQAKSSYATSVSLIDAWRDFVLPHAVTRYHST